jgi:hypothetical protein
MLHWKERMSEPISSLPRRASERYCGNVQDGNSGAIRVLCAVQDEKRLFYKRFWCIFKECPQNAFLIITHIAAMDSRKIESTSWSVGFTQSIVCLLFDLLQSKQVCLEDGLLLSYILNRAPLPAAAGGGAVTAAGGGGVRSVAEMSEEIVVWWMERLYRPTPDAQVLPLALPPHSFVCAVFPF